MVGIIGPRQSGKTTLAKMLFPDYAYVSFENLDTRERAQQDPRGFLAEYLDGAIFDEIQRVPELLSYLQQIVDEGDEKGRFIITGSQNFALSEQISQSLAGRIGMVTLLPLSVAELGGKRGKSVFENLFEGSYPRLHHDNMHPVEFYPSYIQTYMERDVRQLKQVGDLSLFQKFVRLCAGRIGQLVNFSALATDCGVSHTTARQWIAVLEESYLVFLLRPHHQNFNKRLVKMPKLYFYDTGLASALMGLEDASQLSNHFFTGSLYENAVILELLKARVNRGLPPNLYFWRDRTGHEIDCLLDAGGAVKAFEIKLGMTFKSDFIKGLEFYKKLSPDVQQYIVYNGDMKGDFKGVDLVGIDGIEELA